MRPRGLEPPRELSPTRPSTLRVYQFRHRRVGGQYSPGGMVLNARPWGCELPVRAGTGTPIHARPADIRTLPSGAAGRDVGARLVSVLRPRYISEHMFDVPPGYPNQGAEGWT